MHEGELKAADSFIISRRGLWLVSSNRNRFGLMRRGVGMCQTDQVAECRYIPAVPRLRMGFYRDIFGRAKVVEETAGWGRRAADFVVDDCTSQEAAAHNRVILRGAGGVKNGVKRVYKTAAIVPEMRVWGGSCRSL